MAPPKYQVLDNRIIRQWKVTELRDELKRRKLSTKGLKEDLVKRLDEAVRLEREADVASEKNEVNGFDGRVDEGKGSQAVTVDAEVVDATFESAGKGKSGVAEPIEMENVEKVLEVVDHDNNKYDKQDDGTGTIQVDINNSVSAMDQEFEHKGLPAGGDSANVGGEVVALASAVATTITVTDTVVTEVVASGDDSYLPEKNNEESAAKLENEESKVQLDDEDKTPPQLDCDTKPLHEDPVLDSSVPENQVSEVNPSLGSQVKSDSISSDSVSINQKNELKDTIINDNVKLEQDIVKPEMVEEPSSRNDEPVYDELHSMDVGGLHEKKASVEENINIVSSPDLNKTNSSDDVGYPEKLNLDRSSGDDSMEEDLPETKQIDSKFNVDELKVESIKEPIVKEESNTVVVGDGLSAVKMDTNQDPDTSPVTLAEKRKFPGKHHIVLNNHIF